MLTILAIFVLGLLYLMAIRKASDIRDPDEWLYDKAKETINEHFGSNICKEITVDPIMFIYEDFGLEDAKDKPISYLISATIKSKTFNDTISILVEKIDIDSMAQATESLIHKIIKETNLLTMDNS